MGRRIMTWWKNWFNTTEIVEEPDPFIEKLKEKGCHYNEEENCWERTWLVATKSGAETSREVYVQSETGWRVVMYGNTGDVFFEHSVNNS